MADFEHPSRFAICRIVNPVFLREMADSINFLYCERKTPTKLALDNFA